MTHQIKCWIDYFHDITTGQRAFDLRKNDRNFTVGDTIHLQEFDPTQGIYTGKESHVTVSGMIAGTAGLKKGYCLLSLKLKAGENTTFNVENAGKQRL